MSEHRADAVEHHGAADHAGGRGRRGAEERAAAESRRSRTHGRAPCPGPWRPPIGWPPASAARAAPPAGPGPHTPLLPSPPARTEGTEPRRLVAAEQGVAHVVEEAALARRLLGGPALQLLDAGIGALEGLVLHQDGLHQRVDGVRRAPEPLGDGALGVRIARDSLEGGEAVEQLGDELTFLRGHRSGPPVSAPAQRRGA